MQPYTKKGYNNNNNKKGYNNKKGTEVPSIYSIAH